MGRYIDTADCAKMLRAKLKEDFPGQKFSVRISRYAGGSSIRVKWVDGPTEKMVAPVANHFQGASFDGMTDSMNYHSTMHNGEKVSMGANFVFCDREHSSMMLERGRAVYQNRHGKPYKPNERIGGAYHWSDNELRAICAEINDYKRPEKKTPGRPRRRHETKPQTVDFPEVRENKTKGGIEVAFPARPSDQVRETLKGAGFRWSRRLGHWWARGNEKTREAADQAVAIYIEDCENENGRADGLIAIDSYFSESE